MDTPPAVQDNVLARDDLDERRHVVQVPMDRIDLFRREADEGLEDKCPQHRGHDGVDDPGPCNPGCRPQQSDSPAREKWYRSIYPCPRGSAGVWQSKV